MIVCIPPDEAYEDNFLCFKYTRKNLFMKIIHIQDLGSYLSHEGHHQSVSTGKGLLFSFSL